MTCGLRKATDEQMRKHMDWHFQVNKFKLEGVRTSRRWFKTEEEWVDAKSASFEKTGILASIPDGVEEAEADIPVECVPANDSQTSCPVCSDDFDKFWSDEDENWMYRATVCVQLTKYPEGGDISEAEAVERAARGVVEQMYKGQLLHQQCLADCVQADEDDEDLGGVVGGDDSDDPDVIPGLGAAMGGAGMFGAKGSADTAKEEEDDDQAIHHDDDSDNDDTIPGLPGPVGT